jgi:hypothetical protein
MVRFGTQAVIDELTNLPDDPRRIPEFDAANARIRREGRATCSPPPRPPEPRASSPRASPGS